MSYFPQPSPGVVVVSETYHLAHRMLDSKVVWSVAEGSPITHERPVNGIITRQYNNLSDCNRTNSVSPTVLKRPLLKC